MPATTTNKLLMTFLFISLVFNLSTLFLPNAWFKSAHASSSPRYAMIPSDPNDDAAFIKQLDSAAAQGWRLKTVVGLKTGQGNQFAAFLER